MRASVRAQPGAHFARQKIDGEDFFRSRAGNAGNSHGQFAGKEHGGNAFAHFAAKLLLDGKAGLSFLTLAPVQRRAYSSDEPFHAADGKVQVNGKSSLDVLRQLVALGGFGLKQELINYPQRISLL